MTELDDLNRELQKSELRRRQTVRDTRLYVEVDQSKLPIVYSPVYNIHFLGVEKLHPFDSQKWGNVVDKLIVDEILTKEQLIEPNEATHQDLRVVHPEFYLKSLGRCVVARYVEIPLVALMPTCLIDKYLLKPMRYQTGGTILAAHISLDRGYAINIGGGFHHASAHDGGGFCIYADITLAIRYLFIANLIEKAMIVDLDAHQGNGHERDFIDDERVFILDMFNYQIYPHDVRAREAIRRSVCLRSGTKDGEYMSLLKTNLPQAIDEFQPDLIVYNAGTDTLEGDPLGCLSLTSKGVVKRDEYVFQMATDRKIPVVMLTSGGYLPKSAKVIADSITNLIKKFIDV